MENELLFENREAFRRWLQENQHSETGVWLLFSKAATLKTLKAAEALEEALCFGWIDGQMKKIDEQQYRKYFAQHRKNSKWSEKNKKLVAVLESKGLMTTAGREKNAEAKANGQWDQPINPAITETDIAQTAQLLKENPLAYENFLKMSPSVQKTYTRAYLDAKTDAGRQKRLAWMLERISQNLKPM
ncbi:YdeI/OmpD-associated family protein [Enterococcus sp. HY326]|uniref:YdeI/OmpD-associated family protein n=1 Tax=Enterococcus sp. HY326 TaxID=2971265 RepID=UPI0022406BFA|nr:YdeI/OmpD-associated family protein [Enterococcus sp. HY326]